MIFRDKIKSESFFSSYLVNDKVIMLQDINKRHAPQVFMCDLSLMSTCDHSSSDEMKRGGFMKSKK